MNKSYWLAIFLLATIDGQLQAVKPQTPARFLKASLVAGVVAPVVYTVCAKDYDQTDFVELLSDSKLWLGSLISGAVCGLVGYYRLKKYTPQAKLDWAIGLKDRLVSCSLLQCHDKEGSKVAKVIASWVACPKTFGETVFGCVTELSFMQALRYLYESCEAIELAKVYFQETIADSDDNDLAVEYMDVLDELDKLRLIIEQFACRILHAKQFVNEWADCDNDTVPLFIIKQYQGSKADQFSKHDDALSWAVILDIKKSSGISPLRYHSVHKKYIEAPSVSCVSQNQVTVTTREVDCRITIELVFDKEFIASLEDWSF